LNGKAGIELQVGGKDIEQTAGWPARVTTGAFEVFDLLDGHTEPMGKLGLGPLGMAS
jgi:hypothetical protein